MLFRMEHLILRFGEIIVAVLIVVFVVVLTPSTPLPAGFAQAFELVPVSHTESTVPDLKHAEPIGAESRGPCNGDAHRHACGGEDEASCCGVACHISDLPKGLLLAAPDRIGGPVSIVTPEQLISEISAPLERPPKAG